ncbi:hypothetical protein HMPREF0044_1051 [Gleimia coleocanis DSM 15436]|uniref:Uncharacterized protein n=1 Tax=Gleimia coleocanis DSM 15436 TaxID=525245 RepID=C0W0H3_9ACTO|nr:hypothetical protein [Gleimia coleocanis]EEH64032.1 hypothetical protein HMPREF0044_1051 [Gleimia coleocanis DSM 15436]
MEAKEVHSNLAKTYLPWLVQDTGRQFVAAIRSFAFPLLVVIVLGSNSQAGVLSAIAAFIAGLLTLLEAT